MNTQVLSHLVHPEGDDWACSCGNNTIQEGFYTCSADGKMVEPTPDEWDGVHYFCDRCGTVYNQQTEAAIGVWRR